MSDQAEIKDNPFAETPAKKKVAKKAPRKNAKKDKPVDLSNHEVVILNDDGTDESGKFSISKVTSRAVFLTRNIPDIKTVVIKGKTEEVDYNALKKMSPDALVFGKPVSAIIAAIQLAE